MFVIYQKYPLLFVFINSVVSSFLIIKYFQIFGQPESIFERTCIIFSLILALAVFFGIIIAVIPMILKACKLPVPDIFKQQNK